MPDRQVFERTAVEIQKLLWEGKKVRAPYSLGEFSYANDIYFFHTPDKGLAAASQSFPDLMVQIFLYLSYIVVDPV